jgi:general secretion pathway protein K
VALILTILVVGLIVTLTLQFNRSMRSNLYDAANLKNGIVLACIVKSGFNYACAVLAEDDPTVDSNLEDWADSELLSANSAAMFETGRFEIRIIDHSGKISINSLVDETGQYDPIQKDLLTRFLSLEEFGLDSEEISNLIDAVKDWIDTDDEATNFGAENSYYRTLDAPYDCKNGPLDSLEELLLVKGVGREIYFGTKEKPGISDYLSVFATGEININTADPLVLRALSSQMDPETVAAMVEYREDAENDLKDTQWYKNVPGMGDIDLGDLAKTASRNFEIEVAGLRDGMTKRVNGAVQRNDGALRVLSWKME